MCFFFSSRRRHTRLQGDWSSDVCSSDLWGSAPAACSRESKRKPRPTRRKRAPSSRTKVTSKRRCWRFRNASGDRKSTRLNSSHLVISYAVFCLKKKKIHVHVFVPLATRG